VADDDRRAAIDRHLLPAPANPPQHRALAEWEWDR